MHEHGGTGRRHFPEIMGPGLALFDVDSDHDLDLYLVQGGPLPGAGKSETDTGSSATNRLYLNRGDGTFIDSTEESGAGDTGYGQGVVVGDYDGDGAKDIYVLNFGPNALYRNRGDGTFEKIVGEANGDSWSVSGAFFDADGDGDLDLYVANYVRYDPATAEPCRAGSLTVYCSPEPFESALDRLYLNEGGRFKEIGQAAGIVPGRGMGVVTSDLDGDGDSDIFVTNDRTPNHLYRNLGEKGQLLFAEEAAIAGLGFGDRGQVEGSMGVVIGDFSGVGTSDLFMTNFQNEPNRLFVSAGGGFFDEKTIQSGLGFASSATVSWGAAGLDVEGDGDLDLAVANGHVYDNASSFIAGNTFRIPDHLFRNDGSGRFTALDFPGSAYASRGLVAGDLDKDGDPDLVIATCGDRVQVWRNEQGRARSFVVVELRGKAPNTDAYGAVLRASINDREFLHEIQGGGGYASHSARLIYLGVGKVGRVERLTVRWPDGTTEESGPVQGGQRVLWRQGEGLVSRLPLGGKQ